MICSICKDRVATINLKEIINNEVTDLNLCKECFELREQRGPGSSVESIGKALDSLEKYANKDAAGASSPRICPRCDTTEEQVRAKGRLGCGECYRTFATTLRPILTKVHGSTEHRGKSPHHVVETTDRKTELRRLHEDLQQAVQSENYERAAKLRDKIKQFESM